MSSVAAPALSVGMVAVPVPVAAVLVLALAAGVLWPVDGQRLPAMPARHWPDAAGREGHDWPRPRSAGARWRARVRREALERELAELVATLAAPLRAGVSPAVAVGAAAPTLRADSVLGPLVDDLSEAAARGDPLAGVWLWHARAHGSSDLAFVGRAWGLSELTGAPLADALACGEQVLRARSRGRERLAAAAAGPRASMVVLCLLPASGPLVGMLMGVDPATLYFSSPLATASLVLGVGLGVGAWLWSRRILLGAS